MHRGTFNAFRAALDRANKKDHSKGRGETSRKKDWPPDFHGRALQQDEQGNPRGFEEYLHKVQLKFYKINTYLIPNP